MENAKTKKRRSNVICIDRDMIYSSAFFSLSRRALQVLFVFLGKRQMGKMSIGKRKEVWKCINNGEIVFTYREAKEKYGITYGAFSRAIDDLVEKVFLDIARQGIGWARVSTLYFLSERWRNYGTAEFVGGQRVKRFSHRFPDKSISQLPKLDIDNY